MHWLAKIPSADKYRLGVRVQAPDGASSIRFVAGSPVTIDLPDAPAYKEPIYIDAGVVDINSAGMHRVVMRATDRPSYKHAHIFKVYLAPV